jgi:DNA-binding IclR family transcriptional regulator
MAKVAHTRELGYAEAFEESEAGVNALAVPVRDQKGAVDAALVISGPTTRYDRPAMERTLAAAQDAAAQISRERGNIVMV